MLRRGPFASRVARVIDEVRFMEDSSVLAIVGPWGSGKSSLINLAVAELGSEWKVIRANIWAPPDVAGVIAELFAAIRTALPSDGRGRKAAELLGEWAPLVTPGLSLIPMVGGPIKAIASGVSDHLARRRAQRPMEQVFDDLSEKLKVLDLRILVILDDVDRLQPDELLTLFKAIRLVASFPGVYYLLAYDEQSRWPCRPPNRITPSRWSQTASQTC
jgi:predicted KAP-like P-loop ATPase